MAGIIFEGTTHKRRMDFNLPYDKTDTYGYKTTERACRRVIRTSDEYPSKIRLNRNNEIVKRIRVHVRVDAVRVIFVYQKYKSRQ